MTEINNNINIVKKGMLDAIKLFKVQYAEHKNIIISSNKEIYINNIEQILTNDDNKNKYYLFGFNFILDNIKNFRSNICVNPILYLLSVEILIDKIINFDELKKYIVEFKKVNSFLLDFYNTSSLNKVKLTLDDIKNIFKNLFINDFFEKICEYIYEPGNVQIQESKQNNIYISRAYDIKTTHICGKFLNEDLEVIFWFSKITEKKLLEFKNYIYTNNKKVMVIFNEVDDNVLDKLKRTSPDNLVFFQLKGLSFIKTEDLKKITDADLLFYCDDIGTFNNYKFGKIKKYVFNNGILSIEGIKYFNKNDKQIKYLNKKNTLDRYFMMQGKTIKIECKEEILENVRSVVSLLRSVYFEGLFYNEEITLKLLLNYFNDNNNVLKNFFKKLLKCYLTLCDINSVDIEKYINDKNNLLVYDVTQNKFVDKKLFTALAVYLNTFALLNSNIEVLSKIY